jgi:hypothetical protein
MQMLLKGVPPFQVIEAKTPQQVVEIETEDIRKDASMDLALI